MKLELDPKAFAYKTEERIRFDVESQFSPLLRKGTGIKNFVVEHFEIGVKDE